MSSVTSAARSDAVARPQSNSSSGIAAARCSPHRDSHRGVESAGDDDGQASFGRDLATRAATPPSGWALITRMSAAPARATASGSVGLTHALVGGDRDAHVLDPGAHLASSSTRRTRLLDVLEVVGGEGVDGVLRLVNVPAAVRIDADASLGTQDRRTAATRAVSSARRLPGLGDLDLYRATAGEPREHASDLRGIHRGEGRIDTDAVAQLRCGRCSSRSRLLPRAR